MSQFARLGRVALILLFPLASLYAEATARLSGTVRDPQGGAVADAAIVATNSQTGLRRTARTSDTGDYVLLELPVGTYQLSVDAHGFRPFVQEGINLSAEQAARNDVALRIGDVSEQVTVTSEASIIDTTDSEIKSTIDPARMQEIPLAGRNILGLATLVPGVTTTGDDVFDTAAPSVSAGVSNNTRIFVNGNRSQNNNFQLDGASFTGTNYEGSPSRYPPPDSVEEVSVLTSGFKAEYGGGTAVFNAVTKSGTNEFHGSAWEFLRNNVMNAKNYFGGADSNKYQYNQFGGALGGPVIRNKLFFFFSYEGLRGRLGNTPSISVVPTAAERAGDLSDISTQLIDPTTRKPFAGNLIPSSRLDPVAQKVMANFVPLPNAASNEYNFSYPTHEDYDQYLFKVDYSITQNSRLSVRGLASYAQHLSPPSLPGFVQNNPLHDSNLTVSYTQTFSPTTLNEVHATVQRFVSPNEQTQLSDITARELGFHNNPVPYSSAVPGTQVDSYFEIGTSGSGTTYSLGNAYIYKDGLSLVRGRHTIKLGGEFRFSRYAEWGEWDTRGSFEFGGSLTGNSLADFLIGRPANYGQRSPLNNSISRYSIVGYAQDDYKASSRLTLNVGFRWDFNANPKERNGKVGFWIPETFVTGERSTKFPNAPLGQLYVGDPGMPDRVGFNHYGDWGTMGPRAGFAYDLFGSGKTVLRGAFGIFSVPVDLQQVNNSTERPPFDMIVNMNYPASYGNPFEGRVDPFPSWKPNEQYDLTPLLPLQAAPNCLCYRNGYSEEWNFSVEHALRQDLKVSLTYVGNHALALWRSPGIAPAIYIPGVDTEGNPLSTPDNEDSRRPYKDYSEIYLSTTDATRHSNGFQVVVQKRFSRGLTISGHYALSNTMSWSDDGARQRAQDELDIFAEYARTNASVRHTGVVSWIYDLPKFTENRMWGALVNSWELTGLFTIRSGFPYNLYTGTDNSLTGTGNDRPDQITAQSGLPKDQRSPERYFNTGAFVPNAIGKFGNVGYNAMTGPGAVTIDTGLFKNFTVTEKRSIQLRGEAFNLFNHPNFGNPDPYLNSPTFGQILTASPARILQVGLKFVF